MDTIGMTAFTTGKYPFYVYGPVASCGVAPDVQHPTAAPFALAWGPQQAVLRAGLVISGATPGFRQYAFQNTTRSAVKFVVDGVNDAPPCVLPGATSRVYQLPASVPQGPRRVTTSSLSSCSDTGAGVTLATEMIEFPLPASAKYTLQYGLFPN